MKFLKLLQHVKTLEYQNVLKIRRNYRMFMPTILMVELKLKRLITALLF